MRTTSKALTILGVGFLLLSASGRYFLQLGNRHQRGDAEIKEADECGARKMSIGGSAGGGAYWWRGMR